MSAPSQSSDFSLVDLDEVERRLLTELASVFHERRRRAEGQETLDVLRRRAETSEREVVALREALRDSETSARASQGRLESVCVEHGAMRQRASELESQNEELRSRVIELQEQLAKMTGSNTHKGAFLEREVDDILREALGWDFETARVGPSLAKNMDVMLLERRPRSEGHAPLKILVECKHKKELKTDDVDKFLRDITEQDPDAAVFYSTAALTATQRSRLAQDDRVVVSEEPGAERRQTCVLGAVARALGVATYRRFVAREQALVEARFPSSLRRTLRAHKDTVVSAHAFVERIFSDASSERKRMRQSVVDADAHERNYIVEASVDPTLAKHSAFDGIVATHRRFVDPDVPLPKFLPEHSVANE